MTTKTRDLSAGEFRFLVLVERPENKPDNSGGQGNTVWRPFLEIFCKIVDKSGREQYSDGSTGRIRTYQYWQFFSWYREEIKVTDRLIFNKLAYNIRSINNLELRNKFMQIDADSGVEQ